MTARFRGSALLLAAALLGVGAFADPVRASAAPLKDDLKSAGHATKAAAKRVGNAGKTVGRATAQGAKAGAKTFERGITQHRVQVHKRKAAHAAHRAKTKAKTPSATRRVARR